MLTEITVSLFFIMPMVESWRESHLSLPCCPTLCDHIKPPKESCLQICTDLDVPNEAQCWIPSESEQNISDLSYLYVDPGLVKVTWALKTFSSVHFYVLYTESFDTVKNFHQFLLNSSEILIRKANNCSSISFLTAPISIDNQKFGAPNILLIPKAEVPKFSVKMTSQTTEATNEYLFNFKYTVPNEWEEAVTAVLPKLNPMFCHHSVVMSIENVDLKKRQFSVHFSGPGCYFNAFIDSYEICGSRLEVNAISPSNLIKTEPMSNSVCTEKHYCRMDFNENISDISDTCTGNATVLIHWREQRKPSDVLVYSNCRPKLYAFKFSIIDALTNNVVQETYFTTNVSNRNTVIDVPVASIIHVQGCEVFANDEAYIENDLRGWMLGSKKYVIPVHKYASSCNIVDAKRPNYGLTTVLPILLLIILIVLVAVALSLRHKRQKERIRRLKESFKRKRFATEKRRLEYDVYEISPASIQIFEEEVLGNGAFGKVYKGKILGKVLTSGAALSKLAVDQASTENMLVAVKVCHDFADPDTLKEFRREMDIMKQIAYHPRFVNMLYYMTKHEPLALIIEYCQCRDLLRYLRKTVRSYLKEIHQLSNILSEDIDKSKVLTYMDVLRVAYQISDGMEFLHAKNFIHCDLAARNILVCETIQKVKIADFGLCRELGDQGYVKRSGKLPIKWLAFETLERFEFSCKTDVWTFGILLYEIITLGGTPYPDILPEGEIRAKVLQFLRDGKRMDQPSNCSDDIYDILLLTWQASAESRPEFCVIKEKLRTMLAEMFQESKGYYGDYYLMPDHLQHCDDDCDEFGANELLRFPNYSKGNEDAGNIDHTAESSYLLENVP